MTRLFGTFARQHTACLESLEEIVAARCGRAPSMSEAAPTLNHVPEMKAVEDDELPDGGTVDHWVSYLPGPDLVPAYLVVKYAAQYRAVVDVLLEAQDTSLTGLSYDDVRTRIAAYLAERIPADTVEDMVAEDRFNLEARLERLVQWGVLTRWQEPARTGEDFLRKRDRYRIVVHEEAILDQLMADLDRARLPVS